MSNVKKVRNLFRLEDTLPKKVMPHLKRMRKQRFLRILPKAAEWRKSMNFYMPTMVYQEKDAVKKHSEQMAGYGKKALIVTGKHSSKQNGA